MKHAFPGSEVNAPKDRAYDYGLNDPDDGHVAHAAMIGQADAIVTDDKRAGFTTADVLSDANIETVYVDQFAPTPSPPTQMLACGRCSRCRSAEPTRPRALCRSSTCSWTDTARTKLPTSFDLC